MSNLIHRKPTTHQNQSDDSSNEASSTQKPENVQERSERSFKTNLSEEEEMEPLPSVPSGEEIPQDTANIEVLDSHLKNLNPRWRNYTIRFVFTWIMIFGFCFMVYLGPLAITLLILAIQVKCFHEIITIGYVVYKSHHLPGFRTISWYFLIASNYYLYGESLIEKFSLLLRRDDFLMSFVTYHRFISFSLYTIGFVTFVLSLKKTYYLKQFTLFGYTHLALLIIVIQSNLMIQNVFEGLIWFLLPVSLIICNDIMAYMFGFFFGKTRLIKLSPKKTWEGFIGGAFSTIIFGFLLSSFLCTYKSFVCPLEYDDTSESVISNNCEPANIFKLNTYNSPKVIAWIMPKIYLYPFQIHALALSVFASTIGPFGGFFASGFKRAFKIKDFGDSIPGHGGFMDRFDCQVIMATFVNVYIHSFIRSPSPNKLFNQLLAFKQEDQVEFLRLVQNHFGNQTLHY
jgi:phosphatidate cytidylyltransferase